MNPRNLSVQRDRPARSAIDIHRHFSTAASARLQGTSGKSGCERSRESRLDASKPLAGLRR
eukprot:1881130-Pyramimonas_sp.AAC.1